MEDSLTYSARTCYGADLSATHLVLVKASRSRAGIDHAVIVDEPVASFKGLPAAARAEIEKDRAVVAGCIPAQNSFTRWLHTPLASVAKARKVLPSLLDIQLPFPLETCVYGFPSFRLVPVAGASGPRARQAVDALAVAARTQDVTARLDLFRQAGLDPARLDHEGLALWTQALRELPAERTAARVVAWLGHDHTSLVLGCGEDFLNAHSVRFGADDLLAAAGTGEPAGALRHLVTRVQQVLRAQFPGLSNQEVQWIWTGPGAAQEDRLPFVQALLGEAITARFLSVAQPAAFLARAIAVRGLQPDALPCNLRTGELTHPLAMKSAARREMRSAVALLVAGLLLCGINLAWRVFVAQRRDRVESAASAAASELTRMPKVPRGQEVLLSQRALEQRKALAGPFLDAFMPSLMSLLSDVLRVARDNQMLLETLSLRADAVTVRGTADDWNRCELLVARLRELGFTADIERQDAGADERVHFAIQAGLAARRGATP